MDKQTPETGKELVTKTPELLSDEERAARLVEKTAEFMRLLKENAKITCNKCYGRGYTGTDMITGFPIACSCAIKSIQEKKRLKQKEENEQRLRDFKAQEEAKRQEKIAAGENPDKEIVLNVEKE